MLDEPGSAALLKEKAVKYSLARLADTLLTTLLTTSVFVLAVWPGQMDVERYPDGDGSLCGYF